MNGTYYGDPILSMKFAATSARALALPCKDIACLNITKTASAYGAYSVKPSRAARTPYSTTSSAISGRVAKDTDVNALSIAARAAISGLGCRGIVARISSAVASPNDALFLILSIDSPSGPILMAHNSASFCRPNSRAALASRLISAFTFQ